MKSMKKIMAFVLAMVMTLAMTTVVFASSAKTENETTTITVTNLASEGTNTVKYVKILEPNVKAATGYDSLVSGVTAEAILGAKDLQAFVKGLNIDFTSAKEMKVEGTTATATVDAGMYAIYATNADKNVIYNFMVLSVEYDNATRVDDSYVYDVKDSQIANQVVAKFETISVTKTDEDDDKIVGISDVVTYDIVTYMPSQVEYFTLTDTIEGAEYFIENDAPVVTVKVGGQTVDAAVVINEKGQLVVSFDKAQVEGNEGKKVEVSYKAVVTSTVVNNTVVPEDGKHEYTPASDVLYSGTITVIKKDGETVLSGAGFIVSKADSEEYAVIENGKLVRWTEDKEAATEIVTDREGKVVVAGLANGSYHFEEVTAPTGYTVNTDGVTVTIETQAPATGIVEAEASIDDTTLATLPFTGGIGTTIFTIVGCLIMIIAAGLFFSSRKKMVK